MSPYLILILFGVLIVIFIAGLIVIGSMRTRGQVQRALNMTLLVVRVPREVQSSAEGGARKSDKELINVTEQMISGFSNIHSKGWNKFIFGEPYLALEIAVHHSGQETHFYVAVPKASEDTIEKQLYSFFPRAEIVRPKDYSIFAPNSAVAGSFLKYNANPMLPVKTYQVLESDPISSILTSMSKLESEGEGAAMQLLIRPSHAKKQKSLAAKVAREMQSGYQFKEALQRVEHPPKPKKPDPSKPLVPEKTKVVSPSDEEIIKAISAKAGKQIFDVNIRLITSAQTEERAKDILNDFESSFAQYSSPDINGFKVNHLSGRSLNSLIYNYSFRIFNNKQAIVMSVEELSSIYHFPIHSTAAPTVKFLGAKTAEPPVELPNEGVIIGTSTYRGQEKIVRMTDEDRRRHLYIIGQTGTGKTVTMKAMFKQDVEAGKGACVIDPHGDFAEFAASVIPKERADDVIYFDPGDIERPMGLNMLEIDPAHPEQKTMVIDELFGIFDRLYDLKTTGGPMFEKYFKNSALLLLDDYENEIPVLASIARVLTDDAYRADKLSRETNPLVKEFWQKEAEKAGGEAALANMAPYISSKVTSFVYNEFLRPIINQQKSAFNIREIIDNGKILIIQLSKGRIGEMNSYLIGMVIVGKLLMAALSRVDMAEKDRKDFYLYIDEFQNFTTPSIATILSEARKYRLCLNLAHQYVKQLKDEIRDAVFGNVGSILSFRISADDAEYMKNKFAPVFEPQDMMGIETLYAYASLLINGKPARPFNMKAATNFVFGVGSPEIQKAIIELSRLKFGRPREEVENEIRQQYEKKQIS